MSACQGDARHKSDHHRCRNPQRALLGGTCGGCGTTLEADPWARSALRGSLARARGRAPCRPRPVRARDRAREVRPRAHPLPADRRACAHELRELSRERPDGGHADDLRGLSRRQWLACRHGPAREPHPDLAGLRRLPLDLELERGALQPRRRHRNLRQLPQRRARREQTARSHRLGQPVRAVPHHREPASTTAASPRTARPATTAAPRQASRPITSRPPRAAQIATPPPPGRPRASTTRP